MKFSLGDMESLSTVVVENLSGCARTDYRSNHALLERAKFRRKLLNYKRGMQQSMLPLIVEHVMFDVHCVV
jgi:hypothetical protein